MKRGILETVASIVCFSVLIWLKDNPYWLIPMFILVIVFLGYGGDDYD